LKAGLRIGGKSLSGYCRRHPPPVQRQNHPVYLPRAAAVPLLHVCRDCMMAASVPCFTLRKTAEIIAHAYRGRFMPFSERIPTTTRTISPPQQTTSAVCPKRELTNAYRPITIIPIKINQKIVRDAKGIRFITLNLFSTQPFDVRAENYILNTP